MSRKVKWELRHDTLAPRIWSKLPEQDRLLRQIHRSLVQRQADYAAGKGSLLGERELEAWRAYRGKLELPDRLDRYFEESEAGLRAEQAAYRRRQWLLIAGIGLVAVVAVAAVVSNQFRSDAVQEKFKADSISMELTLLVDSLESTNRQLDDEKLTSQSLAQQAQDTARYAREQEAIAKTETARATRALEAALQSLLREADGHIRTLNYEKALAAIRAATELGVQTRRVADALMEIAYYRIESHQFEEGRQLAEETARLYGKTFRPGPVTAADSLFVLRAALQGLAPLRFAALEQRYYPTMIPIKGGSFMMGCDPKLDTICRGNETLHLAKIGDFEMAATETTLWQFSVYCAAEREDIKRFYDASWGIAGDLPVTYVTWYNAVKYGNWVSRQKRLAEAMQQTGHDYRVAVRETGFRLPTEAEWEYAAREGGRRVRFGNGQDIADPAAINFNPDTSTTYGYYYSLPGEYRARTTPVGMFPANSLGLFDMSGNVWEWCWDGYADYPENPEENYSGFDDSNYSRSDDSGQRRVMRGGSWDDYASGARASRRKYGRPDGRIDVMGFRLAMALTFKN